MRFLDGLIEPVARGEWHLSEWWGRAGECALA
jgi:hypothetical protein